MVSWREVSRAGREYYSENYQDYQRQTSPRKLDFYLRLVKEWVPPGSHLFELGVGFGHFLERAAVDYVCSGSDVNAYGLEQAQRRVPRARLWEGSFERIPKDTPPAAVVAWDVLEHIQELDEALRCIRSRLRERGVLIGVVPVYDGPLGWLVDLLDHDPTHVSKWSRGKWTERLESHGFEIVDSGGVIRRLLLSRWYLHITRPQRVLRRTGSALYFVARKMR